MKYDGAHPTPVRGRAGSKPFSRGALFLGVTLFCVAVTPCLAQPDHSGDGVKQTLPEAFDQTFRDGQLPPLPWGLIGPNAHDAIRPGERGLRITVPPAQQPRDPVGVVLPRRIKGDFDITFGYEILELEPPPKGNGAGLEFYLLLDTPRPEVLGLLRVMSANEGDTYATSHLSNRSGKPQSRHSFVPTSARVGRLRVSRVGGEATLWALEGSSGSFRALAHYSCETEDVKNVRLSVYPGAAQVPVSILIRDFQIRPFATQAPDAALAGGPAPEPPADTEPVRPAGTRGWWLAAAALVALTIVLAALAAWARERRGGRARERTSDAADCRALPKPDNAPATIACACPACEKKLQVRASLAAKRITCPGCGAAVRVPLPENG